MIRISRRAAADLLKLHRYMTTNYGEPYADRYLDLIERRIGQLKRFKRLGPPAAPEYRDVRRLTVQQHTVIYRLTGADVLIVRVLHQRQDPEQL